MRLTWFKWIDIERLIHSIKTAIAVLLGIFLTKLVGFTADQWIVISILVVMCAQIYVGSVVQKGYFRFLGTVFGCLIAVFALVLFGDSLVVIAITVALSGFIFSYLATGNEKLIYLSTLGSATTAIIMLGSSPSIAYACERFSEITIGILIATVVSQFVLPIHARTHLRRTQAKTLRALCDYYQACILTPTGNYEGMDESIAKLLSKQRQLAIDSKREPLGSDFNSDHCVQLLQCEKEILRAIDFMHHALLNLQDAQPLLLASANLKAFNQVVINYFDILIDIIHFNKPMTVQMNFATFTTLQEDINQLIVSASYNDKLYLNSVCFTAEVITQQTLKLSQLYDTSLAEAASISEK